MQPTNTGPYEHWAPRTLGPANNGRICHRALGHKRGARLIGHALAYTSAAHADVLQKGPAGNGNVHPRGLARSRCTCTAIASGAVNPSVGGVFEIL